MSVTEEIFMHAMIDVLRASLNIITEEMHIEKFRNELSHYLLTFHCC